MGGLMAYVWKFDAGTLVGGSGLDGAPRKM